MPPVVPPSMPPVVPPSALALLQRQGGLARRRDLVRCGVTRWRLDVLVDAGALRVVHRDVLSARRDVPDDEAVRAAVVGLDGVASHSTAARVWGIELLESAGCEVTVGRDRSRAVWPGVDIHRRRLAGEDVRVVGGLRVTAPVRTVVDLCLTLPLTAAVASTDAAVRAGVVALADPRRACLRLLSGQERSRVARVLRLVDPRSGSVLESVCRVLFAEAELPAPLTQFEVRRLDGRLLGRVDFAWLEHRLVVETDGFAFHADRVRYRTDRRRTNALLLDGWRVLRFSWEDVVHSPETVVEAVRAALLHTR
jgi:very-short-patch-repair endonuclease